MDANEYQKQALKFAVGLGVEHMAFGLLEEAGEVAGNLKRAYRGDDGYTEYSDASSLFLSGVLSPMAKAKIASELGDLAWYMSALAGELGFSFSEILEGNIAKLTERRARNAIRGSGDER